MFFEKMKYMLAKIDHYTRTGLGKLILIPQDLAFLVGPIEYVQFDFPPRTKVKTYVKYLNIKYNHRLSM